MLDRHSGSPVTVWLTRLRLGDAEALDRVVPLLYRELRRVARRQLSGETCALTLSATALVHETYLRLVQQRHLAAGDRQEFLAIAAQLMRRVLVDHARRRHRLKRGRQLVVPMPDEASLPNRSDGADVEELLALDQLIGRLEALDPRAARIVEYRIFAGLTEDEIGVALGVSTRSVQRSWAMARAWLRSEMTLRRSSADHHALASGTEVP